MIYFCIGALFHLGFFSVPPGFTEEVLASNLKRPVGLAFAPDGRLFLIEQYTGKIKIFKNGSVLPTPFATVSPVYAGNNETGLLGICVDPDFTTNKFLYVFHTHSQNRQRILRYKAIGDIAASPTILVDHLPSMGINHNGGGIGFGPDGKLYVSVGENGSFTETEAQNIASKRGKLLRYNPDGTIPPDNPFGPSNPVFCYGLRNSFRFSFQPGTGKIFATENGPNWNDEINVLKAGKNYGWPAATGTSNNPSFQNPITVFPAPPALTGLAFYAAAAMPFNGQLFVCLYKFGKIIRIKLSGETVVATSDFATGLDQPVDITVGPDGAFYLCTLPGKLTRVASSQVSNLAPQASFTATPNAGSAPLSVSFDASSSNDSDGTVVSYAWNFGDGSTATGVATPHMFTNPGNYSVSLKVTDNAGSTAVTTQNVLVSAAGNQPPSAHIESATPSSGATPLTVSFLGHGHDDTAIVHHHWNFGDDTPSVAFPNPGIDNNSSPSHTFTSAGTYIVTLTVKDDAELTGSHQVTITVTSPLQGLPLNVGQTLHTQKFQWKAPYAKRWYGTYGQYVVSLQAGKTYTLTTSNPSGGTTKDTYLYLLKGNATVVAQDNNSGGNQQAKIVYTPTLSSTYYVRLRAYLKQWGTCSLTLKE